MLKRAPTAYNKVKNPEIMRLGQQGADEVGGILLQLCTSNGSTVEQDLG